jgi:hypothetical protein
MARRKLKKGASASVARYHYGRRQILDVLGVGGKPTLVALARYLESGDEPIPDAIRADIAGVLAKAGLSKLADHWRSARVSSIDRVHLAALMPHLKRRKAGRRTVEYGPDVQVKDSLWLRRYAVRIYDLYLGILQGNIGPGPDEDRRFYVEVEERANALRKEYSANYPAQPFQLASALTIADLAKIFDVEIGEAGLKDWLKYSRPRRSRRK